MASLPSTLFLPSFFPTMPTEPLCFNLPVEVIEHIIDMCNGDTEALSNVSQTCRVLVPRCRLHLFVQIRIRTMAQMYSVGEFLECRPWIFSLVKRVTISPLCSSPIPIQERLALYMVIPLPLLKLPNVDHWTIVGCWDVKALSLSRPALIGFGHYGTHIRHFTLKNFTFPSSADFGRLLLTFPKIEHLECSGCTVTAKVPCTGDEVVCRRLMKRLRLTHLSVSPNYSGNQT